MKKPLIALSFAVASALALADSAQYKQDWFKGIDGETETSISGLKTTNGSWTIPDEAASFENASLVLDLGSNEEAKFEVGATDPGEAGAAQALTVTGIFNPIAPDDLLTGTQMATAQAQVGFAVVGVESEGAMTYKYYAWVGGSSEAAAENPNPIADWLELGVAENVEAAKTITIGLSYWTDDVTATFTLGADPTTATVLAKDVALTGKALEAAAAKKIASISCTGSGTLNALSGAYQYAVAEAEGRKFGTAVEAISAAQATGGSGVITLLRPVEGTVEVSGGLRVWQKNDEALKASVKENFSHKAEDSYPKSATVSAEGYHEWQVNKDVLEEVVIGTKKIGMGASGFIFQDGFRTFLEKNCGDAYRSSSVTKDTIAAALADSGTNGYPLWQSYVLGVGANEKVALNSVETDGEPNDISLKLASTIPNSPFDITYTVTNTKDGASDSTTGNIDRSNPVVKIPLATGKYSVSFTIE